MGLDPPIGIIRTDGGTQPREAMNPDVVEAYREAIREGAKFPAIDVFYDGTDYWLADGFHRVRAASEAALQDIEATIHQGTVADARWFSYGANKTNGLFRANADKQRAVKAALAHPRAVGLSDYQIAEHCGTSREMIRQKRKPLATVASRTRTGRDGRTIKTINIGRSQPSKRPVEPETPVMPRKPVQKASNTLQAGDLMTPDRMIKALRARDHASIRELFLSLDSLVAAYLSAVTTDKLKGEERIEFMQLLMK